MSSSVTDRPASTWSRAPAWVGWAAALTLTAVWVFPLPLPLSDSGSIDLTVSDVVAVVLWGILGWRLLRRTWRPSRTSVVILVLAVTLTLWVLFTAVVRAARGDEPLQGVLVLRTTLLPLAAYLMFDARLEGPRRALQGVAVVEAVLTLWHLGEWEALRYSLFLGNANVYGAVLAMLVPLNCWLLVRPAQPGPPRHSSVPLKVVAAINVLAAMVFPIWAGSRSTSAVTAVAFLLAAVALARLWRSLVPALLALGVVAAVAHGVVWYENPSGAAAGIYRLVPPPNDVGIDRGAMDAINDDQRTFEVEEKDKSNVARGNAVQMSLDSLKEDPWIGNGQVYFFITIEGAEDEVQVSAHNLVLEHANAFALPGLALYLALLAALVAPGLRRLDPRRRGFEPNALRLSTVAAAGAVAMTQPTSMIMVVMMPLLAVVGAFTQLVLHEEVESDGDVRT